MAIYNKLPVYKVTYDLLVETFCIVKNFSREYKFTIGEKLKNEIIELTINIFRANSAIDKRLLIQKARENIEVVRLLYRLSKDLNLIEVEKLALANNKVESISKQLASWQRSPSKN